MLEDAYIAMRYLVRESSKEEAKTLVKLAKKCVKAGRSMQKAYKRADSLRKYFKKEGENNALNCL